MTSAKAPRAPRIPKPMTDIDALTKIQRILSQLDESKRKRVLAFLSAE